MTRSRKNRRGSSRRRDSRSSKRVFFSLLATMTLAGIYGGYLLSQNRPVSVDPVTLCPVDEGLVHSRNTFLVDTTEPLAPSQVVDVQRRILSVIQNADEFAMVDFYVIRADEISGVSKYKITLDGGDDGVERAIDRFCIPQKNNWEKTPLQRQLIAQLQNVLANMFIDSITVNKVQSASPILDGLRFVAASTMPHDHEYNVYVISDMIENTPLLSMYLEDWYDSRYMTYQTVFFNSRPQFQENSKVVVWALMKPQYNIQDVNWISFWTDMISGSQRVVDLRIQKITGGI